MKKFLLAISLLAFAAPSSAEFSPAEKAEVVTQIQSLHKAISSVYWATQHAQAVPADATVISNYIKQMTYFGWEQHQLAVLKLLDMANTTPDRAADIAAAISAIQTNGYGYPISILQSASGSSSWLTTAINEANAAKALRESFDASLAYLEPRLDVNLALPGATRDKASAIGPHGSWSDFGAALKEWTANSRREWTAMANAFNTCPSWIGGSRGAAFASAGFSTTGKMMIIPAALLAGIVPNYLLPTGDAPDLTVQQHLDLMIAGGTTARPPEFFNVQLALEIYLMFQHVGPEPYDVNGRHTVRGVTYDLAVSSQVWAEAARNVCAADPAFRQSIYDGTIAFGAAWGNMDEAAYHGMLLLKHFQVFPPPGPGGGGGECPTCGPGTVLDPVANECVPDAPPVCPTFEPQINLEAPDLARAVCVEVVQ